MNTPITGWAEHFSALRGIGFTAAHIGARWFVLVDDFSSRPYRFDSYWAAVDDFGMLVPVR